MPNNVFQLVASLVGDQISQPVGYECEQVPDEAMITIYLRVHQGQLQPHPTILIEKTTLPMVNG